MSAASDKPSKKSLKKSTSDKGSPDGNTTTGAPRRWYDHDPVLIEVLDVLQAFQTEVRAQAEVFLSQIEAHVGADQLEKFYTAAKPTHFGNRWYDQDPVVSRAVELLRVVPPELQRQAASKFLTSMKQQGISINLLKSK